MEKFSDIFVDCTSEGTKISKEEYMKEGKAIIIDQGMNKIAGYTNRENGLYTDVPAIIFGDHTRIIKYIDKPFFLGADGVKLLKAKDKSANYKYLYYALRNAKIPNTGYNRHFKWLKEVQIKYPNREKQKEIVEILDIVSIIIQNRKLELKLLDDLTRARFVEMFGDQKTNLNNFEVAKLSDVADIYLGLTHTPNYVTEGRPFLSVRDISSGIIDFSNCHYITEEEFASLPNGARPKAGDMLFCRVGTIGKPVIIPEGVPEFGIFVSVGYLRKKANANNYYLKSWMENEYFMQQVYDNVAGASQINLNTGWLKNFRILLPPLELQNQFADFVKAVDKSKAAVQKALDQAQLLFDSLMQEYFG